jgi:histidinol-phosphate aminotransferase
MSGPRDAADLVRPELRRLAAYHFDLSPCRHKLDQNEAPFEPPAPLKRRVAAQLAAAEWARYPDFHAGALRRALGDFHGWPAGGVLAGNGSNELLDVCLAALAGPGRAVLAAEPSFGLYRMMVQKAGAVPHFIASGSDLRLPAAALLAEVERDPRRTLLLCSPNNPTGDALTPAQVDALLERQEGPVLLDNAYGEFCRHDYRPLLDRHSHLILLRTFSKAWALAGLRLGYLLADPRLVAELVKAKLPYNLGRAAALAGAAVLAAAPSARRRIAVVLARRPQWRAMLEGAGLEVLPSEANFLLVRAATPALARQVRDGLAARGIRVRDVGAYPGLAGCLRVSIGSGAALRATRRALSEIAELAEMGEMAATAVMAEFANPAAIVIATAAAMTAVAGNAEEAAAGKVEEAAGGKGEEAPAGKAEAGELAAGELAAGELAAGELAAGELAAGEPVTGEPLTARAKEDGGARRLGFVERTTGETRVRLALDLDGGTRQVEVANGFFGHMLQALATHGGLGLELAAVGDLHVDLHHTVEDVGIAFGDALAAALGQRRGVVRFGAAYAPLDEALARAVVDLSGRGFFAYTAPPEIAASWVTADFPLTLVADFFQAVADRGRLTLHLEILAARNGHHAAEAAFKAAALALRQAVALRRHGEVPSTKGTLTA